MFLSVLSKVRPCDCKNILIWTECFETVGRGRTTSRRAAARPRIDNIVSYPTESTRPRFVSPDNRGVSHSQASHRDRPGFLPGCLRPTQRLSSALWEPVICHAITVVILSDTGEEGAGGRVVPVGVLAAASVERARRSEECWHFSRFILLKAFNLSSRHAALRPNRTQAGRKTRSKMPNEVVGANPRRLQGFRVWLLSLESNNAELWCYTVDMTLHREM